LTARTVIAHARRLVAARRVSRNYNQERVLSAELKPMLRVAGPVILAELGWMGMGVVDTIMVGPLGPATIGAVGVGSSLHFALAIFGMGLFLGLDTLVSQAFGASRLDECHAWLARGATLAAVLTVPFLVVGFALQYTIPWLGFHPDVKPLLISYFAVLIWSTPFLLFYAAFRRYLQGMHIVTPVMFALVSANVVNVAANWALIYGNAGFPALGAAGAAWATLISRAYMMSVLLIAVTRTWIKPDPALQETVSARASARAVARAQIWRLVELGFPAASQITLEVGVFAAAAAFAGMLTPTAVASHQIAMNIIAVAFMIPLGLSSAGAVRVGHAVGAGEPRRAAAAGWTAILLGAAFMALMAVTLLIIPRVLIGFFTQDEDVLTLGSSLLFVAAVFQLFDGLQGVTTGALRGLGDTRTPMITNLAGHWLVGLPVGYTLCFVAGLGVIGLWIGLSVGLTVVGIILLAVWRKRIAALGLHEQYLGAANGKA
jgi:MATE family multidrug resistance protein